MDFHVVRGEQRLNVALPIVLMFANEMPEFRDEGSVLPLGLVVRLRVVCRCRKMRSAELRAHNCKELCHKWHALVGEDVVLYPVRYHPVFAERGRDKWCCFLSKCNHGGYF